MGAATNLRMLFRERTTTGSCQAWSPLIFFPAETGIALLATAAARQVPPGKACSFADERAAGSASRAVGGPGCRTIGETHSDATERGPYGRPGQRPYVGLHRIREHGAGHGEGARGGGRAAGHAHLRDRRALRQAAGEHGRAGRTCLRGCARRRQGERFRGGGREAAPRGLGARARARRAGRARQGRDLGGRRLRLRLLRGRARARYAPS